MIKGVFSRKDLSYVNPMTKLLKSQVFIGDELYANVEFYYKTTNDELCICFLEKDKMYTLKQDTIKDVKQLVHQGYKGFHKNFQVYFEENEVGKAAQRKTKGIVEGITYTWLKIFNKEYRLYQIGFGKKGVYKTIYRVEENKEIQVAEIRPDYSKKDNIYDVEFFVEDNSIIQFILILLIISNFFDKPDLLAKGPELKVNTTLQKALLKKYNPDFVNM